MGLLFVSGHYPAISEHNVPRNPIIQVIFNEELVTSSIDYRVISLHDRLYSTIPGNPGIEYTNQGTTSGIANILTFTPSILLDANTRYNVYVNKKPDSVLSVTDEQLDDSYKFSFYTGSGTLEVTDPTPYEQLCIDIEHAIDIGDYEEAARLQAIKDGATESGVLPAPVVPSGVPPVEKVEELQVVSTYPTNEQPNVSLSNLKFVEIKFNDVPVTSGISLDDYISIAYKGVLE
tara:strand:+ start:792 stop:1490 length:699 start_codon:yes stop_codon:yes gene_type:complete